MKGIGVSYWKFLEYLLTFSVKDLLNTFAMPASQVFFSLWAWSLFSTTAERHEQSITLDHGKKLDKENMQVMHAERNGAVSIDREWQME